MTQNAIGWAIIHVYHYTWSNGLVAVYVYGMEYAFGAHDYSISGVFEVEPRTCLGFIYICSISLRHTNMSPSEFRAFIETIASEYNGDTYHLTSKNCKNFTDDISHRLNCKGIPGWVNRLAKLGGLCSCLLPDSLEATTVKQLPEYYAYGMCHKIEI
ncbi:putative PPPDE peptidase domain, PPPDE putative peptidase domain superfamily [Helianthus anomalus]